MRKLHNLLLIACLVCLLSGCAASQPDSTEEPSRGTTWQEQYDLGVRYLSDGNYEGAILAFSAAIEIDPKRAPAYVGRGDAYVKSGETEENLTAALADYENAIELDETSAEAYLGLADVYIRQGDVEKALEILKQGLGKVGENENISKKIEEFEYATNVNAPWGTRNFDGYSTEQKQFIENLVITIEQGNRERTWEMLKDYNILGETYGISFTFQQYRIRMYGPAKHDEASIGGSIEVHPFAGRGFYSYYREAEDGAFDQEYVYGECKEWNWNGKFEQYNRSYYPDDSDTISIRSGIMRDGLLDGNVKDTTKRIFVGKNAFIGNDWERTDDVYYNMGVRTDDLEELYAGGVYSAISGYFEGSEKLWDWRLPQ